MCLHSQVPFGDEAVHIPTDRKTRLLEAILDKIMYVKREELPDYVDSPWDSPTTGVKNGEVTQTISKLGLQLSVNVPDVPITQMSQM